MTQRRKLLVYEVWNAPQIDGNVIDYVEKPDLIEKLGSTRSSLGARAG